MSDDSRWEAACHEGGHAVVTVNLGGKCRGVVLLDNGGLTGMDELLGNRLAYALAAGNVAGKLAKEHPAPAIPTVEPRLLTVDEIEALSIYQSSPWMAAQLCQSADERRPVDSDERQLALWAITGREDVPGEWATMIIHAKRMAEMIISQNVDAVLRVAAALYASGSLSESEITCHMEG